ncbi:MAG: hypothetical protein FWD58_01295 [Firmicutes bacterium]|nr:hypothetical protein [Bacillota bacterium]
MRNGASKSGKFAVLVLAVCIAMAFSLAACDGPGKPVEYSLKQITEKAEGKSDVVIPFEGSGSLSPAHADVVKLWGDKVTVTGKSAKFSGTRFGAKDVPKSAKFSTKSQNVIFADEAVAGLFSAATMANGRFSVTFAHTDGSVYTFDYYTAGKGPGDPVTPGHDADCDCPDCKPVDPHPPGCTCPVCNPGTQTPPEFDAPVYINRPAYSGPSGTAPGVDYPAPSGAAYVDEPEKFEGLNIRYTAAKTMEIVWEPVSGASSYAISRAGSRLGQRETIGTVNAQGSVPGYAGWGYVDTSPNAKKYENYYFIVAKNASGADIPLTKPGNPPGWEGNNPNPFINCQWISLEKKIFGDYTLFYDAAYDAVTAIAKEINDIAQPLTSANNESQMSSARFQFYLKPGNYAGIADLNIAFYMALSGLGITPDLTKIGGIRSPGALGGNLTHNFWRSVENFETGTGKIFAWNVSQAAPARRINVLGDASYFYNASNGSGGFVSDTHVSGSVSMGGQQQFYHRNCDFNRTWNGGAWNIMTQGSTCSGTASGVTAGRAYESNYMTESRVANAKYTWVDETPIVREKPFLYLDRDADEYRVFVPAVRVDTKGISWKNANGEIVPGPGFSVPLSEFYVAKAGPGGSTLSDSAQKINYKLAQGKHLYLQPGWYFAEEPIRVTQPNTVVLGTGFASLAPTSANRYGAMLIDDVPGVSVAQIMFDAHNRATYQIRVGGIGCDNDNSKNPSLFSDIFCRVGGYVAGYTEVSFQINSNNAIGDHCWLWLADHGRGTAWDCARYGLIISGDDVTMYGTFVEHYPRYQTIWYGERGRNYFYQNESPYRPSNQAAYMSHDGARNGWSAYKVWNTVNVHYSIGLGMYDCFNSFGATLDNAMEVPHKPGIVIESIYVRNLSQGRTSNVINDTGGASNVSGRETRVAKFENGVATIGGAAPQRTVDGTAPADEDVLLPRGPQT